MLVRPKFTRSACRVAAAAISLDIYCPRQTSAANPLVATDVVDRWDRQTDGRTLDRFMTHTAYYSDRVITLSTILDKV